MIDKEKLKNKVLDKRDDAKHFRDLYKDHPRAEPWHWGREAAYDDVVDTIDGMESTRNWKSWFIFMVIVVIVVIVISAVLIIGA